MDYTLPVTGNTQTGGIIYGTANTACFALTPVTTLTNNGQSLAAVEGVNDGTTAISTLAVHSFTYSVTYNTVPVVLVPEPSTWALMGLGLVAGCGGRPPPHGGLISSPRYHFRRALTRRPGADKVHPHRMDLFHLPDPCRTAEMARPRSSTWGSPGWTPTAAAGAGSRR